MFTAALDYARRQVRPGVWKINYHLYSLQKVKVTIPKAWLFRNMSKNVDLYLLVTGKKQYGKE